MRTKLTIAELKMQILVVLLLDAIVEDLLEVRGIPLAVGSRQNVDPK